MICLKISFIVLLLWISQTSGSVNLALRRTTRQSSARSGRTGNKAVDGSFEVNTGDCFITNQTNQRQSFWQVELTETSFITHIRYMFSAREPLPLSNLENHKIYISDSRTIPSGNLCFKESRPQNEIDPVQNKIFCNTQGRFITYFNSDSSKEISLCEFEVYGCAVGRYGTDCSASCSTNCLARPCEPDFGRCTSGCVSGFSGERCLSPCTTSQYGPNCALSCSNNCLNGTCNSVNGSCQDCEFGMIGAMCDVFDETVIVPVASVADPPIQFMIVIAILTMALLTLVGIIVFFRVTKRKKKTETHSNNVPYYQNTKRVPDPKGGLINGMEDNGVQYESLDNRDFINRSKDHQQMPSREYEVPVTNPSSIKSASPSTAQYHYIESMVNTGTVNNVKKPPPAVKPKPRAAALKPPTTQKPNMFRTKDLTATYEDLEDQNNKHLYDSLNQ